MNYFTIYFSDLSLTAQESIRKMVRSRIKEDKEKMKELEELTIHKMKDYSPGTSFEGLLEGIIDEAVENQINRTFNGEGEV